MRKFLIFSLTILVLGCKDKREKTNARLMQISESVYASGAIKSENQFQILAGVNGKIKKIWAKEGDIINAGDKLFSINSEIQQYSTENAKLAEENARLESNKAKLFEAQQQLNFQYNKMKLDSSLYFKQLALYKLQVGSQLELEQRELNYLNSKTAYFSAQVRTSDLEKLLKLQSKQSLNNYKISLQQAGDFEIKSQLQGSIYQILKKEGEFVTAQTPLALIGGNNNFILEMQVDENDIFKIGLNQSVYVSMDSYKGKVFTAKISRISPIMNDRNKTFLVEAVFVDGPPKLYPNITFEANILVQSKEKALLIPRNYLLNDSLVLKENGEQVLVQTGIKDLQMIEILSGLKDGEVIVKP